jgi:polar amino acid transport system substrate-binding protein
MRTTIARDAQSELTVPGTLRVGINLGNILLVTGTGSTGDPEGVAPDIAAAVAERLGVTVSYVSFATPGEVADALERDEWDIGLIAVEPKRAEKIAFCDAYVEIEATYLVPNNSPLRSIEDVDQPGVRIAVSDRAAYDLYLTRTLKHAELHRARGLPGAFELFVTEKLDALAGLVPALKDNSKNLPGSRLIEGLYTTVRQVIGTKPANAALKAFVEQFIAEAKETGLVAELIEKHGVKGKLRVASG